MIKSAALLTPLILAFKNRMRSNYRLTRRMGRDLIIFMLSVATALSVYKGSVAAVAAMHKYANLTWLPPAFPLALLFLTLFVMLLVSNAVAALSAFYHSRDLELLLAAPVSPGQLFLARFLTVCVSSSWMVFIFAFPAIAGFGQAYGAGARYYTLAALLLIPYFVLASSISTTLTAVCASLIPTRKTLGAVLATTVLFLGAFLYLLVSLLPASSAANAEQVLYFLSVVSATNNLWAPSYWLATPLGEVLQSSGRSMAPYIILLISSAAGSFSLAYISVRLLHRRAYSRTHGSGSSLRRDSRLAQRLSRLILPLASSSTRALILKEIKVTSRDMVQILQFAMLIGLSLVYVYNFRMLQSINALPFPSRNWWQGILILMNLCMGGFILTAFCSRFVYPSISLEGQAFWLLQSLPVGYSSILRARFWVWYFPTSLLGCFLIVSGATAIEPSWSIMLVNIFISFALCWGIIGLALGIGALFADFEWEHASQLAASFGSLVFMMASFMLILACMIPAGILIFLYTSMIVGHGVSNFSWNLGAGLSLFLIVYINQLARRWALNLGENALIRRTRGIY